MLLIRIEIIQIRLRDCDNSDPVKNYKYSNKINHLLTSADDNLCLTKVINSDPALNCILTDLGQQHIFFTIRQIGMVEIYYKLTRSLTSSQKSSGFTCAYASYATLPSSWFSLIPSRSANFLYQLSISETCRNIFINTIDNNSGHGVTTITLKDNCRDNIQQRACLKDDQHFYRVS